MRRFRWQGMAAVVALLFGAGISAGDDKGDSAKKELKAFEGNWKLKRQETKGVLLAGLVADRSRLVIEDGQISWYSGDPNPTQKVTFEVDPSKSPKTIDAEITVGDGRSKKMLGIYKLGKDALEICWGEKGSKKRPTKFTTKPGVGSGHTYATYKREKE